MKDPGSQRCDRSRETAFPRPPQLRHDGPGRVHRNGLAHRRRKRAIHAQRQHPLPGFDVGGPPSGSSAADRFVDHLLEPIAGRTPADQNAAPLPGPPRAPRIEPGLRPPLAAPLGEIPRCALRDAAGMRCGPR